MMRRTMLVLVAALLVPCALHAQDSTRATLVGDTAPPVTFASVVPDLQYWWHHRMDMDGRILCLHGAIDSTTTTRRVLVVTAVHLKPRCDKNDRTIVGGLAVLEPAALGTEEQTVLYYQVAMQRNPGYNFMGALVGLTEDADKRPIIWGAWNIP